LLSKPAFRNSDTWSKLRDLVNSDGYVMVAHNAAFDVDMLKKEGIEPKNVICTLKLARYFDKDGVIPKYGQQYLRYYLKLNVDATPHTALGDILVLEALFNRIYAKAVIEFGDDTVSRMIEVSKNPVLSVIAKALEGVGVIGDAEEWLKVMEADIKTE